MICFSNFTAYDDWTSVFQLKGEEIGTTALNFVSRSNDINFVESLPINVQVLYF